jgi:tetrathionate reductase subunit B
LGCSTCAITCKDHHVDNEWPYQRPQPEGHLWMQVAEKEWGEGKDVQVRYVPEPCQLCQDPPCVAAAKDGAATLRQDGIVTFDPVKSVGQKQIVDSCPYGRIFWNDELQIPQKCDLCLHRLEKGLQPACVNACPTQVSIVGEESALAAKIKDKNAQVLNPELKLDPKVYYAHLPPASA